MRGILRRAVSHSVRQATLLGVQVALAGALFAFLVVLSERHNHRFDLTPTQSFVLSDEAERVARGLNVPIRITAFYNTQEHDKRRQVEDLFQLFNDASHQITYRMVDLDRSPALAKKYGVSSFNTGVIEAGGTVRPLNSLDEEEVTRGILKLTRPENRTLCFITGHGEHSPTDPSDRTGYSEVGKALEKDNFTIRSLAVIPPTGVPEDCTVVVLPGPSQDFLPGEADELAQYLGRGGNILLMIDPHAPASVEQFLSRYDVRAGNDVVVDERNRLYGADSFMPRVPIFDEGTFRKNLDTAAVFALARTVSPIDNPESKLKVLLLALSSPESWARVDNGTVPEEQVRFDRDKDKPGPLPVAVLVTEPHEPGASDKAVMKGRMMVFGDSDFASNLYFNLLGNKDLFMSSVGVLAEDEQLIAMRRKGLPHGSLSPVSLTAEQGRLIFWMAVIVMPAAFALLGILITARRRRHASA